jgi:hypothetical protein
MLLKKKYIDWFLVLRMKVIIITKDHLVSSQMILIRELRKIEK